MTLRSSVRALIKSISDLENSDDEPHKAQNDGGLEKKHHADFVCAEKNKKTYFVYPRWNVPRCEIH